MNNRKSNTSGGIGCVRICSMFRLVPIRPAKGFTLVEVLVSTAIFMIAVSLGVLAVVSMNSASKRVQVRDQTMQSAYFLMDSLSRSIRMGKDYDCITTSGVSVSCSSTLASGLSYTDQEGINVKIIFRTIVGQDYGVLYRNINNSGEVKLHDEYSLKLKGAGFMVDGLGYDTVQPFVTIRMNAIYSYKDEAYSVPIQTTLTQRELDVPSV